MRKNRYSKWPSKVKRHLLRMLRFAVAYVFVETLIQTYQNLVGFEHYALIEWAMTIIYFSVCGWFIWRLVNGIRYGDLLVEDWE